MEETSAERLEQHIAGRLIAGEDGRSPRDALAQIFARNPVQDSLIVPAAAEPPLVCFLTGSATVEERSPGGDRQASACAEGQIDRFALIKHQSYG